MVSFSGSEPAVKSGTEGGSEGVLASRISQGNGKAAFPGAGLGCGIGVEGGMQERSAWRNCQSSVSNQHSLHDDKNNLDGMVHTRTNTHTKKYLHMPVRTHTHMHKNNKRSYDMSFSSLWAHLPHLEQLRS